MRTDFFDLYQMIIHSKKYGDKLRFCGSHRNVCEYFLASSTIDATASIGVFK